MVVTTLVLLSYISSSHGFAWSPLPLPLSKRRSYSKCNAILRPQRLWSLSSLSSSLLLLSWHHDRCSWSCLQAQQHQRHSPEDDFHKHNDNDKNYHHHPMTTTSHLSHVMLRVPSVDETVTYWKNKGGILDRAKYKPVTAFFSNKLSLYCNSILTPI